MRAWQALLRVSVTFAEPCIRKAQLALARWLLCARWTGDRLGARGRPNAPGPQISARLWLLCQDGWPAGLTSIGDMAGEGVELGSPSLVSLCLQVRAASCSAWRGAKFPPRQLRVLGCMRGVLPRSRGAPCSPHALQRAVRVQRRARGVKDKNKSRRHPAAPCRRPSPPTFGACSGGTWHASLRRRQMRCWPTCCGRGASTRRTWSCSAGAPPGCGCQGQRWMASG